MPINQSVRQDAHQSQSDWNGTSNCHITSITLSKFASNSRQMNITIRDSSGGVATHRYGPVSVNRMTRPWTNVAIDILKIAKKPARTLWPPHSEFTYCFFVRYQGIFDFFLLQQSGKNYGLPNCHRQMHSSCRAQSHRSAAIWCDRGSPNHGWCPKEKHGTCEHIRYSLVIGFSGVEIQYNAVYQWSEWNWNGVHMWWTARWSTYCCWDWSVGNSVGFDRIDVLNVRLSGR